MTGPSTNLELNGTNVIDESERGGKASSLFWPWCGANVSLLALSYGSFFLGFGISFWQATLAALLGTVLSFLLVGFSSLAGKKSNAPTMVLARATFGVKGAVIPGLLSYLVFVGWEIVLMSLATLATGTVFMRLGNLDQNTAMAIGFAIAIALTVSAGVLGFAVIMRIQRILTIVTLVMTGVYISLTFDEVNWSAITSLPSGNAQGFIGAIIFGATGIGLGWVNAAADYSRYLPSQTSSLKTFFAAGAGSVVGAQVAMILGVFAAAMSNGQFAGHEVAYIVGLGGTGATAALLYFSIAFGKVTISTLNSYGSFMCIATIISGFRGHLQVSRLQRLVFVLVIVGAATLMALLGQHSFLGAFKSFILFLLAFFTPWSAINLVDYYCITRERYDVTALADPDGRYGRWNLLGISVYVFGVLVQLPFISTKFYTGPLVAALGDVDISWIIGLVLPAALYYVCAKKWHGSVPDQLILPQGSVVQPKTSGNGRAAAQA